MKIKLLSLFISLLAFFQYSTAQKDFNNFVRFYPIGDDPSISFKSSYVKEETILFDANPNVRFSFYNDFIKGLLNNDQHTQAWYVSFKSQIRMYVENSLPVKTPSYRVLIGTQHLFRLPGDKFFGFSLESGHYSNGQSGCAFSTLFQDESAECDSIYNLITPDTDLSKILNRKNGNFSTNLTELVLNYRINVLDDDFIPYKISSFRAGLMLYHDRFLGIADFGGYSDHDIKIYGRYRYLLGYEYSHVLKKGQGKRFSVSENIELIQGAHKHVNPLRSETTFSFYPFSKIKDFGFFISYVYGHDNYNYRFVDAGHQVGIGVTWSQFPPFAIKRL